MIIFGRVVKRMPNENGLHLLVKPLQSFSHKDGYDFKQDHYLVSGNVIKEDEFIAFDLNERTENTMHQCDGWVIPSYWLNSTNLAYMMDSSIISAMPAWMKKRFLSDYEKDKRTKDHFRKIADLTVDDAAKKFKLPVSQAQRMILQVKRANALSAEFALLHSLHIRSKSADKLVEVISGSNGLSRALEDPYSLMEEHGMTFKLCDMLGSALKVDKQKESRYQAAVIDSIQQLISNGNSAFNENRVIEGALRNLGYTRNDSRSPMEKAKDGQRLRRMIVGRAQDLSKLGAHNVLSTYEMYESEAYVGALLKTFIVDNAVQKFQPDLKKIPAKLNEQQRQGIFYALENRFSIVTGGPGTGKTTVIQSIVDQFPKVGFALCMGAPTGKAASRIQESSGLPAQTLHSLLGFSPGKGFKYNKKNPLPYDLIVVDEFSMVDSNMFRNLLDAVKPGARMIMVGDSDQLPSVDVGRVLKDLIDSKMFAVTELTEPHRAALESYITRTAYSMKAGIMPDMKIAVQGNTEFIFIPTADPTDIRDRILRLATVEIPERFGIAHDDIQILTPQKQTIIGVDELNEQMRMILNPNTDFSKPSIKSMGVDYSVDDRIMQMKNNKDLGISNGDVGKIVDINYKAKTVTVDFDGRVVDIPIQKMFEVKHAFAYTVHKSQGSEYSDVIMPISMLHKNMLTRAMGYTGLTRAKQRFWAVGEESAFEYMVKNTREIPRETVLKYLIGGDFGQSNYYHKAKVIQTPSPSMAPF